MTLCWLKKGICSRGCQAYDPETGDCRILRAIEKIAISLETNEWKNITGKINEHHKDP